MNQYRSDLLLAYDLVIPPALEVILRARRIAVGEHCYNGRIVNARYDSEGRLTGDVSIDGTRYLVRQESFLEQRYWIVSGK